MNSKELAAYIEKGGLDEKLTDLYGADAVDAQRSRYSSLVSDFGSRYGNERPVSLFSVPGRS